MGEPMDDIVDNNHENDLADDLEAGLEIDEAQVEPCPGMGLSVTALLGLALVALVAAALGYWLGPAGRAVRGRIQPKPALRGI